MTKEPNKALENFYVNQYIDNILIVKCVAIDIGIEKSDFIEIIEQTNESELEKIKDRLYKLYENKKLIFNTYQVLNAIDTIRRLRRNPSLMGLTHDGMRLKFDLIMPTLRKSRYC